MFKISIPSLLLITVFISTQPSYAMSSEVIQAQRLLESDEYQKAIDLLEGNAKNLKYEGIEDITEVNKVLGLAYCELKDIEKSKTYFTPVFAYGQNVSIDFLLPSKRCEKYFESLKVTSIKRSKSKKFKSFKYDPKKDIRRYLPYGVGHYKRGNKKKAKLFAITEGALTLTAATSLIFFSQQKTIDGRHINPRKAKAYQAVFLSSIGMLAGAITFDLLSLRSNKNSKIN